MTATRRIALAALTVTLTATVGCGGAVQRGERHLDAGRYDRAAELAARAIDEAPSARAHALAGEAARAVDDLESAWAARAGARALDPGHPATLRLGVHLAVATDDERLLAEVWVDAWDAGQADLVLSLLDGPGLVTASEALATLWRDTPLAANGLLQGLVDRADGPEVRAAVTTALADASDLQLYRLVADRDLDEAEALIDALTSLLGDAFVLRKHRTLIAAERSLHPSRGPLLALVDDDLDALAALAFELRARGVHRSAALAWRIVADRSTGETAADAWRQAAESEYRLGFEARAREAHDEAFAATARPASTALDLYRTAASRGDALALQAYADRLATIPCSATDVDTIAEAFDALVEGWILEARPVPGLVDRLDARIADAACPGDRLLLGTAIRMAAEDVEPLVAGALLDRAVARGPNPVATRARIALAERRADPLTAAEALRTHVARTTRDGWPTDDAGRALLDVLGVGRSGAVRDVRMDTLRRWHAAVPADRDVTRMLATEALEAGQAILPLWEAHAQASADPWGARLFAAAWMTARDVDPTTRIGLLDRIIAEASTRRMPLDPVTEDADTVYESALLLRVEAGLETGRDGDVVDALEAWIASRGPADPDTWDHIWSRRALIGSLGADERARLARRAVEAGYETPDIWHELAIAESGAGRDAAARAAIDGALAAAPERTGELVDRLVETGRVGLALYTLDVYTALRGNDTFVLRRTLELHVDELLRARGSSDMARLRDHRNGVARAVTRILERGQDLHLIDLERLRLAGLDELAWRVGARRVRDPAADRFAALEVAADALAAGLPLAQVQPWLGPWMGRLDEDDAVEFAALAIAAGHVDLALDLRLGVYYDQRRPAARIAMLAPVMYAASIALPLEAYRDLVDELVEAPARSIADPAITPIPPFEAWADDAERAAELYATAAALYEMRGLDADVVRTARRALELGLDVAAPTLEAAIGALARTTPDLREAAGELVGATSLGAEGWSRAARIWIDAERWDDAAWALERASRLVGHDEPSLLSWAGVVAAHRGDDDGVRAAIDGLTRFGRAGDAELAAGLLQTHVVPALTETGRHDLIDRAIEAAVDLQPGDDDLQLDLAQRLVLRGDIDGARRRAADVAARNRSTRGRVRAWLRAGFAVDAARLIDQADERDPRSLLPADTPSADDLPAVVARLHGAARWYAALDRSEPANIDAAIIRLERIADGLCYAQEQSCGAAVPPPLDAAMDERLLRDDVLDLATLATVRGDLAAHERAWDRAAGEAFGLASFDPEIPAAVVLADHAEAGLLADLADALIAWDADGVSGADEARRWLALLTDDPIGALARPDVDEMTLRRAVTAGWAWEVAEIATRIAADDPGDPRVLPGIVAAGRLDDSTRARQLAEGWLAATGQLSHPRADVAEALLEGGLVDEGVAHLLALLDTGPDTVAERAAVVGLGAAHVLDDPGLAETIAQRWLDRTPSSRSHRQRVAATLMDRGAPHLAASIYADLVDDQPTDTPTWEAWITALLAANDDPGATGAFERMRAAGLVTSWTIGRLARRVDPAVAPQLAARLDAATLDRGGAELDAVAQAVHLGDRAAATWLNRVDAHPAAVGALIDAVAMRDPSRAADLARAALDRPERAWPLCDAALRAIAGAGAEGANLDPTAVLAHVEACRPLATDPNGWQTDLAGVMAAASAWPLVDTLATRVLLEEPDNGVARALRAAARAHLGRTDDAIADARISQGVDVAWRDALVLAARALVATGADDAALEIADRLAARVSFRGVVLPGMPRTNRDGLFDAFDALEPSPALTLRWLDSRFAELRDHPELTAGTTAITNALVADGRVDEALSAWQRATVSRPDSALAHNNHAWTLAEEGLDLDGAEVLARRAVALEREPNANTLDTLAWILHLQGRHGDARALLVQAFVALHRLPPVARAEARPVLVEHLAAVDAALAQAATTAPEVEPERRGRRGRR